MSKKINFDNWREIQNLTESHLKDLFDLEFVASEINLENFRIDALAFNKKTNTFVLIEYKNTITPTITSNVIMRMQECCFFIKNNPKYFTELLDDSLKIDFENTQVMIFGTKLCINQINSKLNISFWQIAFDKGNVTYENMKTKEIKELNIDQSIIQKPTNINSTTIKKPFNAYKGKEPYIFVSYAHIDRHLVFPEIKKFHEEGYPIWYDDGLTPGQEWDEEIEEALENCSLLIVFISKNSMASKNVVDEIRLAIEEDIDIVPIHLEETTLARGLKLRLSNKHAIFKYRATEEDYTMNCFKAFDHYNIPKLPPKLEENSSEYNENEELYHNLEDNFPPYEGNEKYICINYAYKDTEQVFQEIKKFNDKGYHIWYSNEINTGATWENNMLKHLNKASLFIIFMTANYINFEGVNLRIYHALRRNIPILLIYLDDSKKSNDLIDKKLRDYELPNIPCIEKTNLSEEEYVEKYMNIFKEYGLLPQKGFFFSFKSKI